MNKTRTCMAATTCIPSHSEDGVDLTTQVVCLGCVVVLQKLTLCIVTLGLARQAIKIL